jgi:NTP pyrophosphatase (non-canonical NTP hydrolase)
MKGDDQLIAPMASFAMGLAGEAGEVVDLLKKHLGHGHDLDKVKLTKELGDVLWYVSAIAQSAGLDLGEIAHANVEKLRKRYPNGFSVEASRNRAPEPIGDERGDP